MSRVSKVRGQGPFAKRIRAGHATVHALLEAGHSHRSIGRRLHITHRTVKSLADTARPEDLFRGQWQHNRTSALDEYKPYLDERWDEGCANAWKLWEEITPLGYRGSYGIVSAYIRKKRTSPVTAQPPAPGVVTGWILSRPESLTEIGQLQLKAVLADCPELDALIDHVRSFARMLTECQGERLPQWLDAVRQDDLPSLHTLAEGIDRDRDAVIAGLTLPWNSGVVEGHVNRIKMLKRQMFGRAGFALQASPPRPMTYVRGAWNPASIRDSHTRSHAWERGEPARSTATSPQTSSMNLRNSPTNWSSTCLSRHSNESPAQEHASVAETAPRPLLLVPSSPAPSRTTPSRWIQRTTRGNRFPNYRRHSARRPGSHWTGYVRPDQKWRRGGWTVPTPTSGIRKCNGSSRHSKNPLVSNRDHVTEGEPEPESGQRLSIAEPENVGEN